MTVPAQVHVDGQTLRIERAWPDTSPQADGTRRISVEAVDRDGRVRAARLFLDDSHRLERVDLCPFGADPKLPALEAAAATGPLVTHRYGKRAVVRGPRSFLKVVRPGAAAQVRDRAAQGRVLATAAGLDAPAVLTGTDDLVEFATLPGRTLHELGGTAGPDRWRAWWGRWAAAWPVLATGTGLAHPDLPRHDGAREADTLRQWAGRAETFATLPASVLPAYRRQVHQVAERLRDGTAQPLVVAHRDLHDKQLLAHDRGLGLLDFDTAALAEPALDLANLLVHIRLRQDQGLWPVGRGAVAEAAVLSVAADLAVPGERLAAYAESTRLRLAALYSFRPRYRELAGRWATGV